MKSLLLKLFMLSLVLAPLTKLCSQTTFVKHSMAAPIGPIDLYVQDINGDQYQDVVTISYPAGELSWWESIGAQSFTKHMIKTGYAGGRGVRAADIDGDGDTDIIVAAITASRIEWLENNGLQVFTSHAVDAAFTAAHTVEIVDVNQDGRLDVIGSGWNNTAAKSEVAWWENKGSKNFTKHLVCNTLDQSPFVGAGDFNGDGYIDLIAADETPGELYWFQNDGSLHFTQIEVDARFSSLHTILPRDVDHDGDLDILACAYTGTMAWYENDGTGIFTKHNLTGLPGAMWLDMNDLDLDGDNDLIAGGNGMSIYLNDGTQKFSKKVLPGALSSVYSLGLADMDNDLDTDIVALGFQTNALAWYENQPNRNALLDGPAWIVPGSEEGTFLVSNPERGNIIYCHDTAPDHGLASGGYREGMLLQGDLIWVTSGPYLQAFDLNTGIMKKQIRTDLQLLSVIAPDDQGGAWVSAPLDGKVLRFDPVAETVTYFCDRFDYPGAMRFDPMSALMVVMDGEETVTLKSMNLVTAEVLVVNETSIAAGGDLVADGIGNWYISSPLENAVYSIVTDLSSAPVLYLDALQSPWGMWYDAMKKELLVVMNSGGEVVRLPATATDVETFSAHGDLAVRGAIDPASGDLYIRVVPQQPGTLDIMLVSLAGRVIRQERMHAGSHDALQICWPANSLKAAGMTQGIYVITAVNENSRASARLALMR